MKLKDQVTSLELSQKLKTLEVPQKSLFYWEEIIDDYIHDEPKILQIKTPKDKKGSYQNKEGDWEEKFYSAFTVAELGGMLPIYLGSEKHSHNWRAGFFKSDKKIPFFSANTEADARAQMLIYLLENKLITLKI